MPYRILSIAMILSAATGLLRAVEEKGPRVFEGDPYAHETKAERDTRMAWWREAKFGMFIHWGVYAVPAGEHQGVRDAEWIMRRATIPVKTYRDYAKQFTAENYDPQAWVDLAVKAGMRYMVITSKHHDGFALYPTEASDWDAVDASPAGRDLIEPLAKAARAKGMKFGLYYSHSQDWVHPGGAKWRYNEGTGWDDAHKGSYDDYLKDIAVPQVREILTCYQPDVLWWDTPHHMTPARSRSLVELLALRPGIIHNDRLGGGYHGDTETPENFIPPAGYPGRDWETCMTMNDNWGYVKDDHDWKSLEVIIGNLIDIVSKGGNYLLNVGPDATGRIPKESVERLTKVGEWMKVNGEAVYGTQASPFRCRLPWGRCTTKPDGENTILYLHVLDVPQDGRLMLPGLKNEVLGASFLSGGATFEVSASPHGPCLLLPAISPGENVVSITLKLRLKGKPLVEELPVLPDPDGVIRLTPVDAGVGGKLKLGQNLGIDHITQWDDPADSISWNFIAAHTGGYLIKLTAATESDSQMVKLGGVGDFACEVPKVEKMKRDYKTVELGVAELEEGKTSTIRLKAVPEGWKSVNVFSVELVPVKRDVHGKKRGEISVPKDIKSYCLDFNWGEKGEFAKPGTWKDADPAAHVAWYKTMGVNVIQTFCVSTNGYAWYKNGVVPEQPGLKHDFLRDVVKLGHKEGMVVMGYFCIGSNTRWGTENPALSYGVPSAYHIPYTDEYLAYLSAAITDAVKTTGIDGFMIDWLWQPKRLSTNGKWIDAEKKLYTQLMGEEFPGEDQLKENSPKYTAYSRKALDRCWKAIRKAAKDANPACIIWLTTNKIKHPHLLDSDIYREVDWILNEAGSVKEITQVKPMVGKDTRLITCFADWNGQDASKVVPEALAAGVGLYGFAKPDGKDGLINLNKILPKQLSELSGNIRNIAVLARAYRGKSMDSEWANGEFVEPAAPPPLRIEFRSRKGWQDTALMAHENDKSVITIRNPYQSGRGQLTRVGNKWPSSIVIRLLRKKPDIPGPTHFRIANGKLGVSVTQLGETKVVAGEMQGDLDLKKAWLAQGFLSGGNPESPIKIEGVEAKTTDEWVEVVVPAKLLDGNPETLVFEWCNGDNVR